ncbi:hypothetical protein DFH08DRAFT_801729 [Mycena albidolilacea]|uniref:Uncharacterized protein n=1 Tax=Mycena albidolilacea TaxID=1033008 RepID=A0AAD7AJ57_9AGAR|nr:hypothetical protein DFH08DRAFT_801729 [Mycena albidolilacea]
MASLPGNLGWIVVVRSYYLSPPQSNEDARQIDPPGSEAMRSWLSDSNRQKSYQLWRKAGIQDTNHRLDYRSSLLLILQVQSPSADRRAKQTDSKRFARGLDRKLSPPAPSLYSLPRDEYVRMPFELCTSMHKAETRATSRSNSTSYALIVNRNTSPIPRASLNRLTEMSHRPTCGQIISLRRLSQELVRGPQRASLVVIETVVK